MQNNNSLANLLALAALTEAVIVPETPEEVNALLDMIFGPEGTPIAGTETPADAEGICFDCSEKDVLETVFPSRLFTDQEVLPDVFGGDPTRVAFSEFRWQGGNILVTAIQGKANPDGSMYLSQTEMDRLVEKYLAHREATRDKFSV